MKAVEMCSCRLSSIVERQRSRSVHDTDSLSQQQEAQREKGNDRKSGKRMMAFFSACMCLSVFVQDGVTHWVCLSLLD